MDTFRNPSPCCWFYLDKNVSDGPGFLSALDSESLDNILENPDQFTDWANWKYPNSFSLMSEFIDSEISEWFWICYTFNPMLSEAEVLDIMREYLKAY